MCYYFFGISTGIPSFIGNWAPQPEHNSPFLSFVYSKSALQRVHASISNNSLGMGSFACFWSFFAILKPKPLYTTSYYFFINLTKVIDTVGFSIGGNKGLINLPSFESKSIIRQGENMDFTAVIKKGEKQFVALCPELDVVSQGYTVE